MKKYRVVCTSFCDILFCRHHYTQHICLSTACMYVCLLTLMQKFSIFQGPESNGLSPEYEYEYYEADLDDIKVQGYKCVKIEIEVS